MDDTEGEDGVADTGVDDSDVGIAVDVE